MDPQAAVGSQVKSLVRLACAALVVCGTPARAFAADRYALVVTGASGGPEFARKYDEWRAALTAVLRARFGYPDDHVLVLADAESPSIRKPTRENVRAAIAELKARASKDDVVLIVLIGHGNVPDGAGEEARFNLIGPDLSAREWADLVRPIQGRLVFVNCASGSAPFLQALSAHGRVVITATDTAAQQYETVFPQFFIRAFTAPEADADKDGVVSMWEAFSYASAGVRTWYEQQGRLQTERALLDDDGDGVGREALSPGSDGALARVTRLEADRPIVATGDAQLTALLQRRAAVQAQIDELRARRAELPPDRYDGQMEPLLLELARIDAQVRSRQTPSPRH